MESQFSKQHALTQGDVLKKVHLQAPALQAESSSILTLVLGK
jgi:hypothetical protein